MLKVINTLLKPLLALVFLAAIIAFACTYTVRFTETGVLTTFGAAGDKAVKSEPGLYLKWPYPFQTVTKYDRRVRLVQTRSETQQTADDFQIIVEAYMTYRVSDPLVFFQSFSSAGDRASDHFKKAEDDVLRDRLRSQLGEISKFRMDQLFSAERGESELPILESRVLELMRSSGGFAVSDYGVEVVSVGIDRIVLPEETTNKVMERMGANRDRIAQRYESEGDSIARSITAEAQSNAEKIRAFARRRAAEIIARGEQEAAPYLAQQNTNPELAIFLQNIEMMREAMSKRLTLIVSTSDFGLGVFSPEVLDELRSGQIPAPSAGEDGP